jgi:hypothetical protein
MSANLLRNADHLHELADDRESAYWVLIWVLLRYTQHNLSPDKLAERMSTFDETLWMDGTASGGNLKVVALLYKSEQVEFADRPGLRELINNLADIFFVRYRGKPSEKAFKSKKLLSATFLSEADSNYEMDVASLKSDPQWLVRTLRDATSNGDWPTNDGPVKQEVGSIGPGNRKYQGDGTSQPNSKKMKP